MSNEREIGLTKRQTAVLDDLFSGQMDEEHMLQKHKLSLKVYQRWLSQKQFAENFAFRIQASRRQGQLIVAKFIPAAAAKLVELTTSEKEETARKACLDIMSMPLTSEYTSTENGIDDEPLSEGLSSQLAGRLLEILAGENQ